jgi:hypothetical protein
MRSDAATKSGHALWLALTAARLQVAAGAAVYVWPAAVGTQRGLCPLLPVERAFRGSPEPGADVIREVAPMSAPVGRIPLPTKWSGRAFDHTGKLLTRSIHRARIRHPCLPPHVTRLGTCGRGGPSSLARGLLGIAGRGLGSSRFRRPRASTLALPARLDAGVAPPLKLIAFNVRDRHRLGKHGGKRVHLSVVDVSVEEPLFSSRVMRSIAKRPLLCCVVAARTYRTRSIGMS